MPGHYEDDGTGEIVWVEDPWTYGQEFAGAGQVGQNGWQQSGGTSPDVWDYNREFAGTGYTSGQSDQQEQGAGWAAMRNQYNQASSGAGGAQGGYNNPNNPWGIAGIGGMMSGGGMPGAPSPTYPGGTPAGPGGGTPGGPGGNTGGGGGGGGGYVAPDPLAWMDKFGGKAIFKAMQRLAGEKMQGYYSRLRGDPVKTVINKFQELQGYSPDTTLRTLALGALGVGGVIDPDSLEPIFNMPDSNYLNRLAAGGKSLAGLTRQKLGGVRTLHGNDWWSMNQALKPWAPTESASYTEPVVTG